MVTVPSDRPLRICLVGNPHKPAVPPTFERLRAWLQAERHDVTAALDGDVAGSLAADHDFVIVLGGDGTILTVAGALGERQLPIIGVNMGKLGYLAEYSADELQRYFAQIRSDRSLVSHRMMLELEITPPSGPPQRRAAVNDCVIHAGAPFRMIELGLALGGQEVTHITGDGLILATPTGSTAHNLSSGGPILQPDVQAIIVTPICPHSLTHRPVVVSPEACVEVRALQCGAGTTAVIDGQQSMAFPEGTRLEARRSPHAFRLVRHPDRPAWLTLVRKLSWGRGPLP